MAYDIPPLRFAYDALEPHVSAAALRLRHEIIHHGYLDGLNALLAAHPEADRETVEDLLRGIDDIPGPIRQQAAHLAGGHANHQFLWKILGPQTGPAPTAPVGGLAAAIDDAYGSFDGFRTAFTDAALALPTEGWAFLSLGKPRTGDLEIVILPGNGSVLPIAKPGILICNLWDHMGHAGRADWLDAYWHVIDWEVGEYRYQGLREGKSLLWGPTRAGVAVGFLNDRRTGTMTEPAKTIRGVDAEGGGVSAELSTPEFSAGQSMWIATIHCPALFETDKSVAGVDAAQALELAEMLVTELFDHRGIELT